MHVVYNDGSPSTLKRAEDWVKQYAESATVQVLMSDEAYERMRSNVSDLQVNTDGLDSP